MSIIEKFRDYFVTEQDRVEADRVETSRKILEWVACAYHAEFLAWLDSEASAPVEVSSDHMKMVQNAVQSNTFRRIRRHLDRVAAEAQRVSDESRGHDA